MASLAAALLAGCSNDSHGSSNNAVVLSPGGPTVSAGLALSRDDTVLATVNPAVNSLSLFQNAGGVLTKTTEIPVDAEPRSIAMSPDHQRAYVACGRAGTVLLIDMNLRQVSIRLTTGAEPRALCTSPNGEFLYVANAGSNTVSVIDAASFTILSTIDLPPDLCDSPRTLAVTSDGDLDDSDETLFVAGFFSSLRPGKSGFDEAQDDSREGRVAQIRTSDHQLVAVHSLIPVADAGFASNGSVLDVIGTTNGVGGTNVADPTNPPTTTQFTGCFPNQLAAIALHPKLARGYVVSTAASPNGPFAFNSNAQGVVSVFDTATGAEITSPDLSAVVHQRAPLNLDQGLKQDTATVPVLFHTNPVSLAWKPDGSEAWIAIQNSDVLVRMTVDTGGIPTINAPLTTGAASITRVDLQTVAGGLIPLKAPQGVAIDSTGKHAFVLGFVSRSVSVVDLETLAVIGTAESAAQPAAGSQEEIVQLGAELFFSGRGPDGRMSSESWGACAICHPDGLTDNVTWMFDTGPRQTIPLDGMFSKVGPSDQRILNWSAVRDENHDFELNTRGVFGGRGLIDDDRLIFAFGGVTAGLDRIDSFQYNQFLNTIGGANDLAGGNPLPGLPAARRDYAIASLPNGRVFLVGGRAGAGDGSLLTGTGTVVELDPRANTLTARSEIGFTPRHSFAAAGVQTVNGPRIIAFGGYADTLPTAPATDLVEIYDPATDTWEPGPAMPVPTAEFGVAVTGKLNKGEPVHRVHLLGGNTGTLAAPIVTGGIHIYDSDANTWSTLPFGITPRRNLGAAAVVRGVFPFNVFALGGQQQDGSALTTVEAYVGTTSQTVPTDPTTLIASPLTQLPTALFSFAIGTSGNRIYLFGGIDGTGTETAGSFELNPALNPIGGTAGAPGIPSGVISAKAAMLAPRSRFQASSPTPVQNYQPIGNAGRDARQDAINEWIKKAVRTPSARTDEGTTPAQDGRNLFETVGLTGTPNVSCATCHGGPKWTRSTVDYAAPPSTDLLHGNEEVIGAELRKTATQPGTLIENSVLFDVGTFEPLANNEVRVNPTDVGVRIAALGVNGFNIPSLLSVGATGPYLHNGLATTLAEVLDGSRDGKGAGPLNSVHFVADPDDRANLIEFLTSIDADTLPFN